MSEDRIKVTVGRWSAPRVRCQGGDVETVGGKLGASVLGL